MCLDDLTQEGSCSAPPPRPLNWALSFNSSVETKLSEAGPVSSKTTSKKNQALKIEARGKKNKNKNGNW